jgi:hypothetical protein
MNRRGAARCGAIILLALPALPSVRALGQTVSSPSDPGEILLSGGLVDGLRLSNRALVVDEPLGSGHVLLYALRPFWRWQTHGAYPLVFNALLHWNDLGAGQ